MKFARALVASVAITLACTVTAQAQTAFPTKPVRMIVGFPPGGPADLLGRLIGQKLGDAWGQPVIVENRTGAGGNIAQELVAHAAPDGYTLLVAPTGNLTVNPFIFAKLAYDPIRDYAPITQLATVENVLVVNPNVPARNVQELAALAREKPGTLTFGSPASGSQAHLAGEFLKLLTKTDMVHVAYKGTGPALNDLLGGTITMMFAQASSAIPYIKAGKLRALGLASAKRSPALPDVPTIAEQNLPGFEAVSWYALMAPAGTPADVIARIHGETVKALRLPDVREKLAGLGAEPVGNSPAELAKIIAEESARWSRVVREAGIKADP